MIKEALLPALATLKVAGACAVAPVLAAVAAHAGALRSLDMLKARVSTKDVEPATASLAKLTGLERLSWGLYLESARPTADCLAGALPSLKALTRLVIESIGEPPQVGLGRAGLTACGGFSLDRRRVGRNIKALSLCGVFKTVRALPARSRSPGASRNLS
jgi:hypothetical protein